MPAGKAVTNAAGRWGLKGSDLRNWQGLQWLCESIEFKRAGRATNRQKPYEEEGSESLVSRYKVPGGVGLETKYWLSKSESCCLQ